MPVKSLGISDGINQSVAVCANNASARHINWRYRERPLLLHLERMRVSNFGVAQKVGTPDVLSYRVVRGT